MKINLTNDDGVLLAEWTIGGEPEFDVENLNAIPEYDFYVEGNYDDEMSFGDEVWNEIKYCYKRGER